MNKKEKKSLLSRLFTGGSCNCGAQIIEEEKAENKDTKKESKKEDK